MTSESRTFLYTAWQAVFNAELEDAKSNCSSDRLSTLNLSYSSSSFDWSGGGIDTPEAHKTTEELGENTVEPYFYEPEFTVSLLHWQCWKLSFVTASIENHCYWAR